MFNEPIITYNHMQEETADKSTQVPQQGGFKNNVVVKFIAEELIIALLLALIFYMI